MPHGLPRGGRLNARRLLHLLQLRVLHVRSDHADAFRHGVGRAEDFLGEFIEQLVEIPEKRTEGLPMVVFIVGVKHKRVYHLALQVLHNRMVFAILL